MSRDTESSSHSYRKLPFEVTLPRNRRHMVPQQVAEFRPASLLEVGCGFRPVFTDLVHSPRCPAVSVRSRSKAERSAASRSSTSTKAGHVMILPVNGSAATVVLWCFMFGRGRHRKGAAVADDACDRELRTGSIGKAADPGDGTLRERSAVAVTEVGGTAVSTGPIARGSVARVGTATALTAVCGYAMIYLAARDLAPSGYWVFGVFLSAFGLVTGAAGGLLPEATREVRSARHTDMAAGCRTHPLRVAGVTGVVAAVVIAGSAPLWSGQVFVAERWLSVGLLSIGLAGSCLSATLAGMLAGADRWTQYAALMVTDAVIRMAVATAAFVIGWGLVGFLWATAAGAMVAWLLMLISSPTARAAARLLTAGGTVTFLRGAAHSITAAGASAILVVGFPVLLKVTSNQLGAEGGVIILAVTLTRAPLLFPLSGMQSNLIAHFVDERTQVLRALIAPLVIVGGVGAVGVLAAGFTGPWLLRIGFGPDYHTSGALLAWLTAAAVAIAMLVLTGTAAVAAALHRAYSLGWVGATVASTLLLLLPLPLQTRTVIALLCGPLVGIAVHLAALARSPG